MLLRILVDVPHQGTEIAPRFHLDATEPLLEKAAGTTVRLVDRLRVAVEEIGELLGSIARRVE